MIEDRALATARRRIPIIYLQSSIFYLLSSIPRFPSLANALQSAVYPKDAEERPQSYRLGRGRFDGN